MSVQRDGPSASPAKGPPKIASFPLEVTDLASAIEEMPALITASQSFHYKRVTGLGRARGSTQAEEDFTPAIQAATIFCRDAIYRFDGRGTLAEVEDNFGRPQDPNDPDDLPPPKIPVPVQSLVLISEPATKRVWQMFQMEDGRMSGVPYLGLQPPTGSYAPGQLLLLAYYSGNDLAADVDGIPRPGFKAKGGKGTGTATTEKPKEEGLPRWAEQQFDRIRTTLGDGLEPGDQYGTGTGAQGEGAGGGGTDIVGTGTATEGVGTGAATLVIGGGRGGDRPPPRAKPDKVVPYPSKGGPKMNVWVGGGHKTIKMKNGEKQEALRQRIQEAAGQMRSTGRRLADDSMPTSSEGKGGQTASMADLAEATSFNATGMAYPSKLEMQGGSGAEVSPKGWATTVTGANHDFDMILDWDAITFGLANQVWARLEFLSYYWQVIDVSKAEFERTEEGAARTAAVDAKKNRENVREVGHFENFRTVGREAELKAEELRKDRPSLEWYDVSGTWTIKAGMLAVQGISATWDIAKATVGAWLAKVTSPENRRPIKFEKPGEYVVRCLVNPIERAPEPGKPPPGRRGTSIAAFPVRVIDIDQRASEVNREEQSTIAALKRALEIAQAAYEAAPGDAGKKVVVDMLASRLASKEAASARTTTETFAEDVTQLEREMTAILQLLMFNGNTKMLSGQVLADAIRVQKEMGLYARWQLENRLEDLKKSRKAKEERLKLARKWGKERLSTKEIRPRVTLVSEENGAVVRMAMMLGQSPDSSDYRPKWSLLDVTSEKTQREYEGEAGTSGPEGHNEAIRKAFEKFADKAEYGRGTLAIDIAELGETAGKPKVPRTMLMTQGAFGRWQKRLQNLVEIAGLVAPFVEGGALATFATIGGALDAGYKLYDRAANDKLSANFETVTDIMGVLAPLMEGGKALSELKGVKETTAGVVLKLAAESADYVNEWLVPMTIYQQIDQVVKDSTMGGPEKRAAIATILGRATRDKVVSHLGKQSAYKRESEAELGPTRPGHEEQAPRPPVRPDEEAGQPVKGEGTAPTDEGHAPVRPTGEGGGGGAAGAGGGAGAGRPGGGGASSAHEPGMPQGSVETLKNFATNHGIVIDVRPPGLHTRSRLAKGAISKPAVIKAKTINEADRLLGAPPGSLGLVGYFNPELPPKPKNMSHGDWERVLERYAERKVEFDELAADMKMLTDEGTVHVVSGVVTMIDPRAPTEGNTRYRAVAGDVDIFEIHWADPTRQMTDIDANRFAELLRGMGIGVEHGAHLRWIPQSAKDKKIYQDIIASHDPGAKPLLRFEPNGDPRRVNNMTPITATSPRQTTITPVEPGPGTPGHGEPPVADIGKDIEPANPSPSSGGGSGPTPPPGGGGTPPPQPPPPPGGGPAPTGTGAAPTGTGPSPSGTGPAPTGQQPRPADVRPANEPPTPGGPARTVATNEPGGPARTVATNEPGGPARTVATNEPPAPGGQGQGRVVPATRPGLRPRFETTSDLQAPASVPRGVQFEERPASRYEDINKSPTHGQSGAILLYDTVSKKTVLFKPTENEMEVDRAQERGIRTGEYASRTKATELAAEKLGLPTPKVELVKIGDRTGSVTDWVEGGYQGLMDVHATDPMRATRIRNSPEFKAYMDGIHALDYLVNNLDRGDNIGNVLVKLAPDGETVLHVIPIDHDLTFTGTVPRTVMKGRTYGLPDHYSTELAQKLRDLGANRAEFAKAIEPLVGAEAIPGVMHRLDEMLQDLDIKERAGTSLRPSGPQPALPPPPPGAPTTASRP
jgi:hypothetical protein